MKQMQSSFIKQAAQSHGFALCGIAKSDILTIEKERFTKALSHNYHAQKAYLERDIEKRFHAQLLLENCKSVIVCGFNYNMRRSVSGFSQYALIKDYHIFMKEKLEGLAMSLKKEYGAFQYKTTVDSSAISEKAWAVKSGIGYYGKNGIIQTSAGSFVFLGILLIDSEVEMYDTSNTMTCGNCNRCIEACPAKAIVEPYYIDCNQCITHLNTHKNESDFARGVKYGWFYACDVCQNVCPNNVDAPINEEAIALQVPFVENIDEILTTLTPESFEQYFKDTVFYKFKYEGLKKRIEIHNLYFYKIFKKNRVFFYICIFFSQQLCQKMQKMKNNVLKKRFCTLSAKK